MEESRIEDAFRLFDDAHTEDPRTVSINGKKIPWSSHYHWRMSHWLDRFEPEASTPLRLAARCQHIRRWKIPRTGYPEGKPGYKTWRRDMAVFHGQEAGKILSKCGFDKATVSRVKDLLEKKGLKTDPDTQTLEDVICLVFLENEFAEFATKHKEEKVLGIIRKTWAKMSKRGHEEALRLAGTLPSEAADLIGKALTTEEAQ